MFNVWSFYWFKYTPAFVPTYGLKAIRVFLRLLNLMMMFNAPQAPHIALIWLELPQHILMRDSALVTIYHLEVRLEFLQVLIEGRINLIFEIIKHLVGNLESALINPSFQLIISDSLISELDEEVLV